MTSEVFLELLLRDAPAMEYETPVLRARAAGEDPERIAELERAKVLALRVRGVLERRRRREAELAALYQTASDLAALRDLDSVLRAIVRRARRLLDTDVAYLTLHDPERGDTYMRVTDGSISAAFQRVRLPMGAGLGGLVAQTATPYATANYTTDQRFRHTAEIDYAVGDEGLVAILGVPLRLGPRVIGVLFAANRSERPFAPEEVALLGSLADHAAIAIDSARLLQETRAALEELDAKSRLLREHMAAVERAAEAHDRLADLVLQGGGIEQVAAAVTDVLGGSLLVLDSDGHQLACAGAPVRIGRTVLAEALAAARETGRAVRRGSHSVAAVVAGSEHLGSLVLERATDLDDADQRILERAALVTALLLLFRRSVAEAESRVRGDLLDDLLTAPTRDPDGLRERARRLGTDLDRAHSVIVTSADGAHRQRLAAALAHLAATRGGLAGRHAGHQVLLLPEADPGTAARTVARQLRTAVGCPVTAGAGGPASGPQAIATAYAEAVRCLGTLLALGRVGDGASAQDLGFLGLVLGERGDIDGFVQATIGPLIAYDERRGTQLVRTLEEYFAQGRSLNRTRQALHVHVNTVTQRLDRVAQILGPDWQDPERELEIRLALRLYRVRGGAAG